ncbi:TetR/AcrR family transcriptional regulator [Thalassospira sp. MCCC 1A01428]|uniref:TetR/AcrR family transcriptional regulator n=1 Tax=unclassified Thalassospira TaxID=2648997 RepID=UPI000A24CFB1|nr:TetR/AcrR family transcriptional regulator [Thalassospira sp. MCCC 1A01428]OSQ40259.1 hypothetical protein THS27_20440 [Thalassospira sp. MCCC 1A01428]
MNSQKSRILTEKAIKAPSRKRGHERVAALLDAGAQVFAERGYNGATMTEIAARAGASIGSLYQFFPKKQHIAGELHARFLDILAESLTDLLEESRNMPLDQMTERLFDRINVFLNNCPGFIAVAERRDIDPKVKKKARAHLRALIVEILSVTHPPIAPNRRPALAAVILHIIRLAANLKSDDDATIRDLALAEVKTMLQHHLQVSRI